MDINKLTLYKVIISPEIVRIFNQADREIIVNHIKCLYDLDKSTADLYKEALTNLNLKRTPYNSALRLMIGGQLAKAMGKLDVNMVQIGNFDYYDMLFKLSLFKDQRYDIIRKKIELIKEQLEAELKAKDKEPNSQVVA